MKRNCLLLISLCVFGKTQAQNLGVGTSTPLMKLHVSTNSDSLLLLENTQPLATGIANSAYFKTGAGTNPYTGAIKSIGQNGMAARLGFFTQASSSTSGLIERLSILNNGNVGIGTTAPDSLLTVAGSVHISGNALIDGPKLEVSGLIKTNNFQMTNGAGAGKILTSDANGNASWTGCGLSVGQTYQGGIIFYLDAGSCHGLVAAAVDQSTGIQWFNAVNTNTTAFANGVGSGDGNTKLISFNQGVGSYAAQVCTDLSLNGYDDWYLPSKYELNLMYMNIGPGAAAPNANIGGFANSYYWSSSEADSDHAWYQLFLLGAQFTNTKNSSYRVRAVRAF